MTTRLLVLSDIHSNLPALEAVLKDAEQYGSFDRKLCAGDIIGYNCYPNEVVERVQEEGFLSVAGNHERWMFDIDPDYGNEDALTALMMNKDVLTRTNLDFLRGLSSTPYFDEDGLFAMVHGSFAGNDSSIIMENRYEGKYIHYSNDVLQAMKNMKKQTNGFHFVDYPLGIFGHTHQPLLATAQMRNFGTLVKEVKFCREGKIPLSPHIDDKGTVWLPKVLTNPGSVGQPRNFSSKACYAVMEFVDDEVIVHRGSIGYNVEKVQLKMEKEGYPGIVIRRLLAGL